MVELDNTWDINVRNGRSPAKEEINYEDLMNQLYDEILPEVNINQCADFRGLFDINSGSFLATTAFAITTSEGVFEFSTEADETLITIIGLLDNLGLDVVWMAFEDVDNNFIYYTSDTVEVLSIDVIYVS